MRVLVVEPRMPPFEREIDGTLASMQEIVGGMIQAIYPFDDSTALICNDEGKLLGLPKNRAVYTDDAEVKDIICGTFFLCDAPQNSEDFASITEYQLQRFKRYFASPERFYQHSGHLVIVRERAEC